MKSANYYIQDTINKFQPIIQQPAQRVTIYRDHHPFFALSTSLKVPFEIYVKVIGIQFMKCCKTNEDRYSDIYLNEDVDIYCAPISTKQYNSAYNTYPALYGRDYYFKNFEHKMDIIVNHKYFFVLIPHVCELYFQISYESTGFPL